MWLNQPTAQSRRQCHEYRRSHHPLKRGPAGWKEESRVIMTVSKGALLGSPPLPPLRISSIFPRFRHLLIPPKDLLVGCLLTYPCAATYSLHVSSPRCSCPHACASSCCQTPWSKRSSRREFRRCWCTRPRPAPSARQSSRPCRRSSQSGRESVGGRHCKGDQSGKLPSRQGGQSGAQGGEQAEEGKKGRFTSGGCQGGAKRWVVGGIQSRDSSLDSLASSAWAMTP